MSQPVSDFYLFQLGQYDSDVASLQWLQCFVLLVERGSFTAVAHEMRVKQSTVSKWLAALEEELGVTLLDRTTRAKRVTDAGHQFYGRAKDVLATYEGAVADVRTDESVIRGRLRINLPVVYGQLFVVPIVAKFLKVHREIEIDMVFSDRYVNLVDEGFDLALRVGTPVDSSLRCVTLGRSERQLVASPGYLKARGCPKIPGDLAHHECLVHVDAERPTAWRFQRRGHSHRVLVRGRGPTNNSEATRALARSGLGIALLASWLVEGDVRSGRLTQILPDYRAPEAPVQALTAPGRRLAPRVRALIEHLRRGLASTLDTADG